MFIDEVTMKVRAGRGGDGAVTFFPMRKGPSGGPGGNGGSVFVHGDRQLADLHLYAGGTTQRAKSGKVGQNFHKNGSAGDDLILRVPTGTVFTDIETHEEVEITDEETVHKLARGGKGGKGNMSFATPTHQVPYEAEEGKQGDLKTFRVILRLIADYGFIGLPNAGKSSLLNELTSAKVKTAMYAFTTLEPNLGVFRDKVIADIPGLIEGASTGKGLGVKFLKHVEKVPILLHCIAGDSKDMVKDYKTIANELTQYNPELMQKRQIIVITKTDLIESAMLKKMIRKMKKLQKEVWTVSIYDPELFEKFMQKLSVEALSESTE